MMCGRQNRPGPIIVDTEFCCTALAPVVWLACIVPTPFID
jgi:hypothetical protein